MRLLTLLCAGLLAQGSAAARSHRRQDADAVAASEANANATLTEPKKFIVEVADADIGAVESKLASEGVKVVRKFRSKVFTGLSIESDEQNIDTLHEKINVRHAWPVRQIHLDPIVPLATFADDAAAGNYSVHAFTGVSELHEQGIRGKGATVAVVDTGVDYRHSAVRVGLYFVGISGADISTLARRRYWARIQGEGGLRSGRRQRLSHRPKGS